MTQNKTKGGLADIIAGSSAICTVGADAHSLNYRGYPIDELAAHARFEEVAYLLLYGALPTQHQLDNYIEKLKSLRTLPDTLKQTLENVPASAHPMDVMRTACSMLGCLEPETDFSAQNDVADRLLALFPSILCYWHRYHTDKIRIDTVTNDDSIAAHFLHMLHGIPPGEDEIQVMNVSLILYAEHEFNASTFAARVAASTLSDFYSAVTAAIGTLRGPLHGGANEAAMQLIKRFNSVTDVVPTLQQALAEKQKIMGFGHRVYKTHDPRSPIIKALSKQLSLKTGDKLIFPVSEAIENFMWQSKKLFPNLDFYSASAYYFMNIPVPLYTPIFICSRITGWAAHIFEQRADNALIRPGAQYTGPPQRVFIPIVQR